MDVTTRNGELTEAKASCTGIKMRLPRWQENLYSFVCRRLFFLIPKKRKQFLSPAFNSHYGIKGCAIVVTTVILNHFWNDSQPVCCANRLRFVNPTQYVLAKYLSQGWSSRQGSMKTCGSRLAHLLHWCYATDLGLEVLILQIHRWIPIRSSECQCLISLGA